MRAPSHRSTLDLQPRGPRSFPSCTNAGRSDPEPQEATKSDQIGTMIAAVMLCIGLFALVMWAESRPSAEKCSHIAEAAERTACYDALAGVNADRPAKGGISPLIFGSHNN